MAIPDRNRFDFNRRKNVRGVNNIFGNGPINNSDFLRRDARIDKPKSIKVRGYTPEIVPVITPPLPPAILGSNTVGEYDASTYTLRVTADGTYRVDGSKPFVRSQIGPLAQFDVTGGTHTFTITCLEISQNETDTLTAWKYEDYPNGPIAATKTINFKNFDYNITGLSSIDEGDTSSVVLSTNDTSSTFRYNVHPSEVINIPYNGILNPTGGGAIFNVSTKSVSADTVYTVDIFKEPAGAENVKVATLSTTILNTDTGLIYDYVNTNWK